MSTLKNIKGQNVQFLSTDPVEYVGTWASTPSLNAACREGGGSGGPTTAINVGGYPYPMTSEHYNGTTWATFANMGTPRGKNATAGSYTNAIVGNGSTPSTPSIGIVNVVDIVTIVNWILDQPPDTESAEFLAGDMNQDGAYNVLDIVTLANCVLSDNCEDL